MTRIRLEAEASALSLPLRCWDARPRSKLATRWKYTASPLRYNGSLVRKALGLPEIVDFLVVWAVADRLSAAAAYIAKAARYLRVLEMQEAERRLMEAKNLSYLNELYFSDSAIVVINQLVDNLGEWLTYVEVPPQPGEKIARPSRERANKALELLHDVLRAEISLKETVIALPGTHQTTGDAPALRGSL